MLSDASEILVPYIFIRSEKRKDRQRKHCNLSPQILALLRPTGDDETEDQGEGRTAEKVREADPSLN